MSIVDAIGGIEDLDSIECIRSSFERVLNRQMNILLYQKRAKGRQVGFLNEIRFKNKRGKKQIPCNGIIVETHKETVDIKIVAPVRFADKIVRLPKDWVCEPFDIVEREFSRIDLPEITIEGA